MKKHIATIVLSCIVAVTYAGLYSLFDTPTKPANTGALHTQHHAHVQMAGKSIQPSK